MKKAILSLSILLTVSLAVYSIKTYHSLPPWTAWGEGPGDNFGAKAASAGDVNGDGYGDIAVWASNFDHTSGKVYVYLGSPQGPSPSPSWAQAGEHRGDDYGHSFGGVGDVNGDGYGDFIAAAQGYSTPKAPGAGKAYLYLGSKEGLRAQPAWTHMGGGPSEEFGDCSGRAGDIDQDGLADVVIGAYGFDHFRGAAFLFRGSRTKALEAEPIWRGEGETRGDWYGYSVCSSGDVRHDGSTGILIGAKQALSEGRQRVGKAYAYYGAGKTLPSRPSWTAAGERAQDLFGWRALKAGDVNGDGYEDCVVSAYSHGGPAGANSGKVYVYLGGPSGFPAAPAWTQDGKLDGALFGSSIASGDFNGDGYSDILVGSPNFRPAGKVYLFLGGPKGLPPEPSAEAEGEREGDHFGAYVANAGDVNGDGFPDILVGAPDNREKGDKAGKVYLYYGGKNGKFNRTP